MQRGGVVAIVAHCVLNANTRVDGLASYPGVHPAVEELMSAGFGLIQLPCPEVLHEGAARPPRPIEYYETEEYRGLCAECADRCARDVSDLLAEGCTVPFLIGIEGSPSCGVALTNSRVGAQAGAVSVRVPGSGVFIQELRSRLEPMGVSFIALDSRASDLGVSAIRAAVESTRSTPCDRT